MTRRNFETCSGASSLDLVDTVADRFGQAADLLATPSDLDRWFGVVFGRLGIQVTSTGSDLRSARELREAIYRSAKAVMSDTAPAPADVRLINQLAQLPKPVPQLKGGAVAYEADAPARAMFALLAADAIILLSRDNAARLRSCPECQMIFFDNSRPGRRIWCSSAKGCGNRAKVRRHRARKAEAN
ncbi:CGNR zinc finger domain-containing protein [Kordiimonas sp.]|uniref:CGNR zinc finger domain-containing protein n=1 Tax=Kordiimonas sp. TaxID=1970157 RepID=UPI003A8E6F15